MKTKRSVAPSLLSALLELTKPRIMVMVLVTTTFSYYLASNGIRSYGELFILLFGTALVKGGAGTLNHLFERDTDVLMTRTQYRPIPAGVISKPFALIFGLLLSVAGVIVIDLYINSLTAIIALFTVALYVLVYTPLKRITWLNTSIGAIPGALPAMGGWTAATNQLDMGAWIMFGILFFWQHPHFYAIAILCKDDYAKAGLKMLPVLDQTGSSTKRQILIHTLLLILVSIMPVFWGIAGIVYLVGAILLGYGYLHSGIKLSQSMSLDNATGLLKSSVIYLPLLLVLIIIDTQLFIR
mgnify:CR=1 FL=1